MNKRLAAELRRRGIKVSKPSRKPTLRQQAIQEYGSYAAANEARFQFAGSNVEFRDRMRTPRKPTRTLRSAPSEADGSGYDYAA